jgi:TetR/AcrR family fatty acid metabolism transcriptional regulator
VREYRSAAEVLQVELRLSNKFLKEYRPEKLWAYLGVFGQIVREGQSRGLFRADVDPFIGMWAFFGALDELAMQWVLSRRADRFPLELAAEQVAEVFIRGLLARPGDPVETDGRPLRPEPFPR